MRTTLLLLTLLTQAGAASAPEPRVVAIDGVRLEIVRPEIALRELLSSSFNSGSGQGVAHLTLASGEPIEVTDAAAALDSIWEAVRLERGGQSTLLSAVVR